MWHMHCPLCALGGLDYICTIVAGVIIELIRFEPEICIYNGNKKEFNRETVFVMRDFLLTFPQICLITDGSLFFWQHDSVSVLGK